MNKLKELSENVKSLKENYPKLTDFEALQIAIKMEQNQILIDGFVLNRNYLGALEAIAIQLGYTIKHQETLPDSLNSIAEAINSKQS